MYLGVSPKKNRGQAIRFNLFINYIGFRPDVIDKKDLHFYP